MLKLKTFAGVLSIPAGSLFVSCDALVPLANGAPVIEAGEEDDR